MRSEDESELPGVPSGNGSFAGLAQRNLTQHGPFTEKRREVWQKIYLRVFSSGFDAGAD